MRIAEWGRRNEGRDKRVCPQMTQIDADENRPLCQELFRQDIQD